MNLASALIKQIIVTQDFEAWTLLHKHYLSTEFHSIHKVIDKHCQQFHKLPTFEELKLEVRDSSTRNKLYAIEGLQVDATPDVLLEYLKNEYVQGELLTLIDHWIEDSIAFETAEETLMHLHEIIMKVEDKVDLEEPSQSMQRIELFVPEDELSRYLALGLNTEYDRRMQFTPEDLILLGGKRGQGKSLTGTNIAMQVYEKGKSALTFTIEMDARATLRRAAAIGARVSASRIKLKNLTVDEWERVAKWWAERYDGGEEYYQDYLKHRKFEDFHHKLSTKCRLNPVKQFDIVYDRALTLPKIRAEIDKRIKSDMDLGIVIVDYINKVKRSVNTFDRFDWKEQVELANDLKEMAQEYQVPILSQYQMDDTGQARFAKGILDAADAAFTLNTWSKEDACITLNCVKMRDGNDEDSFSSYMDWETLRIGPETAITPDERDDEEGETLKTGEAINDRPF